MEILDHPSHIQLGATAATLREYMLLRGEIADAIERRTGARRWEVNSKPLAFTREPRENVRPGDIDGQWVLTINDWSKGLAPADSQEPGTIRYSQQCNGFTPGQLRRNPEPGALTVNASAGAINDEIGESAFVLEWNRRLYLVAGRYVFEYTETGAANTDRDFGAGVRATWATIFNNELVVGFGGSTNKIQTRNTSGTWTTATDNTYADAFTNVITRLWRITSTNQASNIGPTDNPRTLANWSSGITVGDNTTGVTALLKLGERVVVCKPEGMFPGDDAARFENALPHLENAVDVDNGKGALSIGEEIYYPWVGGIIRYLANGDIDEVGLEARLGNWTLTDTDYDVLGWRCRAICAQGSYIWGMFEPAGYPVYDPTAFRFTTNNGVSYTNALANVIDNDLTTGASVGALDTVANGDWIVVGYSAAFDGIELQITAGNTNTVTVNISVSNGAGGWTAVSSVDLTSSPTLGSPLIAGTLGLSRTAKILFDRGVMAADTVDGLAATYWARIQVSAALSATVTIAECRVITRIGSNMASWIYRGRRVSGSPSIIWEPYARVAGARTARGIGAISRNIYPFAPAGAIVGIGWVQGRVFPLPEGTTRPALDYASDVTPVAFTPFYDCGTPTVLKRIVRVLGRGRNIGADNVTILIRPDSDSAISSYSLTADHGNSVAETTLDAYVFSVGVQFSTAALDLPATQEVVEVVYNELPTMREEIKMVLLVADNLPSSEGGRLPDAITQITNLEGLRMTAGAVLKDPIRQAKTVTVREVNEVEAFQLGPNMPALAIQVTVVEE